MRNDELYDYTVHMSLFFLCFLSRIAHIVYICKYLYIFVYICI